MRFCDLFISYKIGLADIKSTIPFTKLPFYRKIAVVTTFLFGLSAIFMSIFKFYKITIFIIIIAIILILIFFKIDSAQKNLEKMLEDYYSPYSEKRMLMVSQVLKKYNLDINNMEIIDMLISEAKASQIQCDYLSSLKKPLKTLGALIVPIVVFVVQKISETISQEDMLTMALLSIVLILLVYSFILALTQMVKDILYRDYNRYDNFISDLHQIKIFYSANTKNLSSIE